MPRIEPLLPESKGAGPLGAVSPNLDQVSMYGRGLEKFGSEMGDALNTLNQRQTQMEISDSYSQVAQKRLDMIDQVQQGTADGTLDINAIKTHMDNWASDTSDNINTAGGKDYFTKQAARLSGQVLSMAAKGQLKVATNNALVGQTQADNMNSAALEKDPTLLSDMWDETNVHWGATAKAAGIPDAQVPALSQKSHFNLLQGAIRGWNKSDPDQAQKVLDDPKAAEFITADQRYSLQNEIKTARKDIATTGLQQIETQRKLQDAQDNNWYDQNHAKIVSGAFSLKSLEDQPISGSMKDSVRKVIENVVKGGYPVEPLDRQKVLDNVLKGNITNLTQLTDAAAKHQISPADIGTFGKLIDDTPQGQVNRTNRMNMLSAAKKELNADDTGFMRDAKGPEKYTSFANGLIQAEQERIKAGKSISDLYNPKSPDYFMHQLNSFRNPDPVAGFAQQKMSAPVTDFGKQPANPTPPANTIPGEAGKRSPEELRKWLRGSK